MTENKKLELNMPECSFGNSTDWEATIIQNKLIAFIAIHYDESSQNPCEEWDGFGQIRSLSTSHINNISIEEIESMLEDPIEKEQMVPLSYFEHGNSIWGVKGTMSSMPDFNWDGVDFAGVWIPDDECIKTVDIYEKEAIEKGKEFNRNEKFKEMASQACKTYTSYCNGEVYGFRLELFRLQIDSDGEPIEEKGNYDHLDELFEDSCWGFYDDDGMEYMKDTINDSINCHLKSMKADSELDLNGEPDYSKCNQESFDRILSTIVGKQSAQQLIAIPGIYEVVSEHFNNDILNEWGKEQL